MPAARRRPIQAKAWHPDGPRPAPGAAMAGPDTLRPPPLQKSRTQSILAKRCLAREPGHPGWSHGRDKPRPVEGPGVGERCTVGPSDMVINSWTVNTVHLIYPSSGWSTTAKTPGQTVHRLRGFTDDSDANPRRLQSLTSGVSPRVGDRPSDRPDSVGTLWTRAPATTARVCRLAQLREQNRRRLDDRRGQNWTPHHAHVTTRGARVERPMRATVASLAAAASGDGGSACANLTKAAP